MLCIVRKAPYRAAKNRIVWAMVLVERDGLGLLYVPAPDEQSSDCLAIAIETFPDHVFEDVPLARFRLGPDDLSRIGNKLTALAESATEDEIRRTIQPEDLI